MRALRISSGVLVWALHFALVYGFTALACARGFAAAAPWAVGAATLAATLATLAIIVTHLSGDFIRWLTAGVAAFALLAILWEGIPALLVAPCG